MVAASRYILLGCWVAFAIYWILKSFKVKRTVERQSHLSGFIVIVPIVIGSLLLSSPGQPRIIPRTDFVAFLVSIISLGGIAITVWARHTLSDNWSADVTLKEGHELVQRGPYRFVRHPIYTGFLSMVLAVAITVGHLYGLVGFGLVVAGFWYKLRLEETLMSRQFPDAYPAYKTRVKALVPWLL